MARPYRLYRRLGRPQLLALGATLLAVLVVFGYPASPARAVEVDSAGALTATVTGCTGDLATPTLIELTGDINMPAGELYLPCVVVLDLAGHALAVRNVYIEAGQQLTIRDTAGGGTLVANSTAGALAGIRTTDATLVIEGGTVTATGHNLSAGIGGAGAGGDPGGAGGTVVITGGTVVATGGSGAAGIGGGRGGPGGAGGTVTITGGTVTAIGGTGDTGGAGIGGGSGGTGGGAGGTVTITGGTVTATGGDGGFLGAGAGIGGGGGYHLAGGVGGSLQITQSALDAATITDGTSFVGAARDGTPATPTIILPVIVDGDDTPFTGTLQDALTGCTGNLATPTLIELFGGISLPAGELTIPCVVVFDLAGHALAVRNIIIDMGEQLTIRDTAGGGMLVANASSTSTTAAGIRTTGATLVVEGGTITATGGPGPAAVGGAGIGGDAGATTGGAGGTVTITGGTVIATGSGGLAGGAGIGGGGSSGAGGGGGTVTITGGTVTATGATGGWGGGAGIGGGGGITTGGAGGTVTITGSTVTATGGNGAGAGGGAGIGGGGSLSSGKGGAGGSLSITADALAAATRTNGSGSAGPGTPATPVILEVISSDADLGALTPSAGTLDPAFDPDVTAYMMGVAFSVSSITVTPTTADASATVTVDGVEVTSGEASFSIGLDVGVNTITIEVTAEDETTKTYTVEVTRAAASSNALLADLTATAGALVPAFDGAVEAYTIAVVGVTSTTVTPTTAHAGATVTVDGTTVASTSASAPIGLDVGANTITVVVTAEDGVSETTYTIEITLGSALLAAASVTPVSTSAGDTQGLDVSFTTTTAIPAGGSFTVTLPAGFALVEDDAYAVEVDDTPVALGDVTVAGQAVTFVLTDAIAADSTVTLSPLEGVTNPTATGLTGIFQVDTHTAEDLLLDGGTSPAVTITPGAVAGFDVIVNGGAPVVAGASFSIEVSASDTWGNPLGDVELLLVCSSDATDAPLGDSPTIAGARGADVAFDGGVGTIEGFVLVNAAESPRITVALEEGDVSAESTPIAVTPDEADPDESLIETSHAARTTAQTATITVRVLDGYGNPHEAGGEAVTLETTHGSLSAVTDVGNGTYQATLSAAAAGEAIVGGKVNSAAVTSGDVTVTFTLPSSPPPVSDDGPPPPSEPTPTPTPADAIEESGEVLVPVAERQETPVASGSDTTLGLTSGGASVAVTVPADAVPAEGMPEGGLRLEVAAVADLDAVVEQAPPPSEAAVVLQFVVRMVDSAGDTFPVDFAKPVALEFVVPADQVPSDADLDALVLLFWNGTGWVEVAASGQPNPDGSVTLVASVQHFTLFSVIWAPPGWGTFDPPPVPGMTLSRWLGGGYGRLDRALGPGGSVWLSVDGRWLGYRVDAPDFVNQRFLTMYTDGLPARSAGIVVQSKG